MTKLREVKTGYAIVEYREWIKSFANAPAIRFIADKEDAIYNARSLTHCDNVLYCVYDPKVQKIIA